MPAELWRSEAACLGEPIHLWFPDTAHPARSTEALEICGRCPVVQPCLTYALEHNIDSRIWGNTTERDRARIKRRRPPILHGTRGKYQKHECRCPECCAANAVYQRDNRVARKVSA